jgi:hypothetical protein
MRKYLKSDPRSRFKQGEQLEEGTAIGGRENDRSGQVGVKNEREIRRCNAG